MNKHYYFLSFFLLFPFFQVFAQKVVDQTVTKIIEDILEDKDEALDYTELVTSLNHYYENPMSLNTANRYELLSLHILSVPQVNEILAYRDQYGGFTTIYELQAVPKLDQQTIQRLIHFVNTDKEKDMIPITLNNLYKYGSHDLFIREEQILEEVKGQRIADTASRRESNKGYLGSPVDFYTRYGYNLSDRISFGVTAEKDAGEEFFKGSQKQGFDYYSGHLMLQDIGYMKTLTIGDYEAQFGQGLVLSGGLSLGKNPQVLGLSKSGQELDAYTSVNENNFFRGIGTTWEFGKTRITGFYSNKRLDGNVVELDTTGTSQAISSIKGSGMHRTFSELEDKNAFRRQIVGTHVKQRFKNLNVGISGLFIQNEESLLLSDRIYDQFSWSDKESWNGGVNYEWLFHDFYFFGELGYSHTGAVANIHGMMLYPGSGLRLGAIYRNYPRDYVAPFANAFRESGQVSNERGVFLALQASPFRNWQINTYFDHFQFPWLQYLVDKPSSGYEYLANIAYDPGDFEMYWRVKGQSKEQNISSDERIVSKTGRYHKWQFRWNLDYEVAPRWSMQTRLENSYYQMERDAPYRGWVIFQDFRYETLDKKLYIIGRYGLFQVDDYKARIYTYENDLLYSFSIPFFQDQGMRYYLVTRLKAFDQLSFWFKFGQTRYFNKNIIGSGYQEIKGDTKTTIKAQIRWQF